MAVDVLGLLWIFRLAVVRAGGRSRCRRPVGLRPLFLSLLAAFRVRTHICLLLVNLPPERRSLHGLALPPSTTCETIPTLALSLLLVGGGIRGRVADAVPPCREQLVAAGVGCDDRRREPGQCDGSVDGASGRDDQRERLARGCAG